MGSRRPRRHCARSCRSSGSESECIAGTIAFPAAMLIFAPCTRPDSMTIATRPPSIESPCNKVCAVEPVSGLCLGCGRSLAEIANWIGMSESERARIMDELPQRLASLQHQKPSEPN